MDFKELLENKPLLYGIIGAVVLFLALSVVNKSTFSFNGSPVISVPFADFLEPPIILTVTINAGKAIEIQALLAKYDIVVSRRLDGTKSDFFIFFS